VSWFASTQPDGLEWSMARTSGTEKLAAPSDGLHALAASLQDKVAFLPDYAFSASEPSGAADASKPGWPAVDAGTTLAGVVGAALTLLLAGLIGLGLRRLRAPIKP